MQLLPIDGPLQNLDNRIYDSASWIIGHPEARLR